MHLITNEMDVFAVRENSNRLQRLSAADIVFFFSKKSFDRQNLNRWNQQIKKDFSSQFSKI